MTVAAILYVLDADHGTKVGITIQSVEQRVADLARGAGFTPRVVATWPVENAEHARRIEQLAHWLLRDTRTMGEWFHCHPVEAVAAVEKAMRGRGIYLEYQRWLDAQPRGQVAA